MGQITTTKVANLTESFLQTTKHDSKSSRFVHITPAQIGEVLQRQGFELISLKTGHAKTAERQGHQTTLARYRHVNALSDDGGGLKYDIIAKIPHLYGAMEFFAGIYRLVCSNGLVAGTTFESYRISHTGPALDLVAQSVDNLIQHRPLMVDRIGQWSDTKLDEDKKVDFAIEALRLRAPNMVGVDDSTVERLLHAARTTDVGDSLWNVFNVLQENLTRKTFKYYTEVVKGDAAAPVLAEVSTRRLLRPNSLVNVEFNRDLFDLASRYEKSSDINNLESLAV